MATSICIVLVAISLRPGLVSVGPLLPAIRSEFGLSHAGGSLLIAVPDLLMGLLALPTPWLAQRFGRNRLVLAALVVLTLAILARAFVHTTSTLLITTVGVGAGIAISGALVGGFIKASFPGRAALLTSIYATSLGVGSMMSAGLSGPISAFSGSWRVGVGIWSLLAAVAVLVWLFIERKERLAPPTRSNPNRRPLPFRVGLAWLIGLFFACDNFLFYACLSWMATIYREHGFDETRAGLTLATYTGAFIVATPLAGALSRKIDRRIPLAIWAMVMLVGLVLLAFAPLLAPHLAVLLIAFGIAGGFTLGMTLPLDNADNPEDATAWSAFVLTIGYVIAAAGPFSVGLLRDLTGNFSIPLWVLVAVGLLMLGLTPFLKPRSYAGG
ncbi:MAG: MFS transporter [Rhizobiaceae bacterium]|nr:MFS transporter [Rhizobiaceae bacterium]